MRPFLLFTALLLFFNIQTFASDSAWKTLLNSEELDAYRTEKPDTVILDIRLARDYAFQHIPGAVNLSFDESEWKVTRDGVVGQIPSPAELQKLLRAVGVNQDSDVVIIYGATPSSQFGAAARAYWTLKVAGVKNAAILNGGLKAWFEDLYPVESGVNAPQSGNITVSAYNREYYADQATIKKNIKNQEYLLVDARPTEFFEGYEKHKAAKSGGTIPGAKNLSQFNLIDPVSGKLLDLPKLQEIAGTLGPAKYNGIISFCNTGHWAATDWFVFSEVLGYKTQLYDGSMVEWSVNTENPLENIKNRFQLLYYSITKS